MRSDCRLLEGVGRVGNDGTTTAPNPALKFAGLLLFALVGAVIVIAILYITKGTIQHHFGFNPVPSSRNRTHMPENKTPMENVVNWLVAGIPGGRAAQGLLSTAGPAHAFAHRGRVVKAAQSILRSTNGETVTEAEITRRGPRRDRQGAQPPRRSTRSHLDWPPSGWPLATASR